ncbi:MAG: tyrosine-type recombinase/integrase [Planctomycetaceae bacterium]
MSNSKKNSNESEPVGEIVSIFRRGNVWCANFRQNGKQKRPSLRTTSKKEARRRAFLLEAELLKGQYQQEIKPATIKSTIEAYQLKLESDKRSLKTLSKYTRVFEKVQALAQLTKRNRLNELDMNFLDLYRSERVTKDGANPDSTVVDEIVIIKQLINFALTREMLATNPLKGLRIPKRKRKPQPWWKPVDIERILAAATEPHVWEFTILADTGFRIGELRHLTWEDVDFANNLLHVREKQVSPTEYWKPKDGDERSVPMSDRVRALLERLPRPARWVVTAPKSPKYPKGDSRISSRRALVVLKRVLKRLGLQGHLHTFRHSLISRALVNGVPESVVREWAGHVDSDILKRYTHIASSVSQEAMKKLSSAESRSSENNHQENENDSETI